MFNIKKVTEMKLYEPTWIEIFQPLVENQSILAQNWNTEAKTQYIFFHSGLWTL